MIGEIDWGTKVAEAMHAKHILIFVAPTIGWLKNELL